MEGCDGILSPLQHYTGVSDVSRVEIQNSGGIVTVSPKNEASAGDGLSNKIYRWGVADQAIHYLMIRLQLLDDKLSERNTRNALIVKTLFSFSCYSHFQPFCILIRQWARTDVSDFCILLLFETLYFILYGWMNACVHALAVRWCCPYVCMYLLEIAIVAAPPKGKKKDKTVPAVATETKKEPKLKFGDMLSARATAAFVPTKGWASSRKGNFLCGSISLSTCSCWYTKMMPQLCHNKKPKPQIGDHF